MERKYCITVGREFCSGGIETAKQVADALDMAYYDKEIIDKTAEMMNLNKDIIASHDEKPVSYLQSGAFQYNVMWYEGDPSLLLSPSVRIAETQFKVIQEAAKKGPAVFVGRCADFALRDFDHVLHVFIRADLEIRIARCMQIFSLSADKAKKLIHKTDKIRADYYNRYSGQTWGDITNNHLIIDAGTLGIDLSAELICNTIKDLEARVK